MLEELQLDEDLRRRYLAHFGIACVHAKVIKKKEMRSEVKVGAKLLIGSEWRLEDTLEESEDFIQLNTSFIERFNPTIPQGSAYLNRRSPCNAREEGTLEDHLARLRCHDNFCPPHSASKFGMVTRTPAM